MAFIEKTMINFLGMSDFSNTQKAACVLWLAEFHDPKQVQSHFKKEFGENPEVKIPTEPEIQKWYDNFKRTGSVHQDYIEEARNIVSRPIEALMERRKSMDIHTTTYEKDGGILNFFGFRKIHKCHPYKMRLKHDMTKEILEERWKFAKTELERIHLNSHLHHHIWFAGEAIFYSSGRVECHNITYLDEDGQKPESRLAHPKSGANVTVWAALSYDGLLGPYISSGHADKTAYSLFLRKFFYEVKQLQRLQMKLHEPIFAHDDSPLHEHSKEILEKEFQSWIGPGSSYATWPKLSPDIHPLCFFLWGFIKSKVYEKPIGKNDDTDLATRIHHAFTEVIPEMLEQAVKAYKERLKLVVEHNGNLVDTHDDYEHEKLEEMSAIKWMMD